MGSDGRRTGSLACPGGVADRQAACPTTVACQSFCSLSKLAVAVLIEEAELTPKPALVDGRGNGAHHDLDLARLRCSALALQEGFAAIARTAQIAAGEERQPPVWQALWLRETLGSIGRAMEQRMLAATDGSNAHRGAIWALGLLVAAAAGGEREPAAIASRAARLARLPDRFAPRLATHGQHARLRYGAAGARGEAQAGFPHAVRIGLPTLRQARARGVSEDRARLDALMAIMARLDDTCLLHRGGRVALVAAQNGAAAVRAAGGTSTRAGWQRLHQLHGRLMALWASPGGSADLLAVSLFLDRLEGRRDGNADFRV